MAFAIAVHTPFASLNFRTCAFYRGFSCLMWPM